MDSVAAFLGVENDARFMSTWMLMIAHSGFIFGWYAFYTLVDCFPGLTNQWRIQSSKVTANLLARTIMRTGICGSYSKKYVTEQLTLYEAKPFFQAEVSTFWKSTVNAAVMHLITGPCVWYFFLFDFMGGAWLRNNSGSEINDYLSMATLPAVGVILLHQFFFAVCEDTMFYWGHRFLHTGPMYRAIHKMHHEHHRPISLGAEYAHPLESAIGNIGPFLLGPLLLTHFGGGCHFWELLFWTGVRMTETAEAHSGYEIPVISIFSMFPWSGALMHDFHHSVNQGAYGTFFRFWDYVCGTDKQYNEFKAKEKAKKKV